MPKKYTDTFSRTLELDNWNQNLPTSPAVNILNHIALLKNGSLPFIPLMILLQILNKDCSSKHNFPKKVQPRV